MSTDSALRSGGLLRERLIIRRTAETLTSGAPPAEVFPRVCELLASHVGAHFVAIVEDAQPRHSVRWMYAADDASAAALQAIDLRGIDDRHARLQNSGPQRRVLIVPLRYGARTFGFLTLGGTAKRFTPADIALLETCARYIAVALDNALLTREKERLEALATHDGLTNVANRRAFDDRLAFEWNRAVRSGEPLSVVMLDIDYFKVYNDSYGHVAGDICLQQVAGALAQSISRASDMVARYGGEEFAAVLPNTPERGGVDVAEKMHRLVSDLRIVHRGSVLDRVTVSVGVATTIPSVTSTAKALVEAADAALYRAKAGGRNRVASMHFVGPGPSARRRFDGRNNLPAQMTSFIGRESELALIGRSLPTAHIFSLLGPGGVGKTRLAVSAASGSITTFPGGAWLVDLGAERDDAHVAAHVARTLGLADASGAPMDALRESLAAAPALLILDSCEHLLAGCSALVSELMQHCPDIRIMTTSRQPLGLSGEVQLRLEPFEVDEAVRLFVDRARDAQPSFKLADSNVETIRAICRRVDGLPLAIELAAARLRTMTLGQLVEHGESLPRQPLLHERVARSYELLDETERRFFCRLSILPGSFDETAARAIGGDERDPFNNFELLTRLVDKSLIQVDLHSGRYHVLSAIAEYGRAKLPAFESPAGVRARASTFMVERLRAIAEQQSAVARADTFAEYAGVADNVRAALGWCLEDGEDVESGAALTALMMPYWSETGRLVEARRWLERALDIGERLSRRRLIDVLEGAITTAAARADSARVEQYAERLRRETGASNDAGEMARVCFGLATARLMRGDDREAQALFRRAADGFRGAGERRHVAYALLELSDIAFDGRTGFDETRSLLEQSLEIARVAGPPSLVATLLGRLGDVLERSGHEAAALDVVRDGAAIFAELGDDTSLAWTTLLVAERELTTDRIVARMHARDALIGLREAEHPGGLAICFELFARICALQGDDETAVRLMAFASAMRRRHGIAGTPRDRREIALLYARLEARMDPPAFERGVRDGRTMTLDGAVERAKRAAEPMLAPSADRRNALHAV